MDTVAAVDPLCEWHEQPELWLCLPPEFPSVNGATESKRRVTSKTGTRTERMYFAAPRSMRVFWFDDWTSEGFDTRLRSPLTRLVVCLQGLARVLIPKERVVLMALADWKRLLRLRMLEGGLVRSKS